MTALTTGLGIGIAYGLLGAAAAVASRATRTLHLAIGPAVVLGALVHLVLVADGRPVALALAAGVAVGALASAAVEPLVLRWLDDDGPLRPVGTFVVGAVLATVGARTLGARTVRPTPLLDLPDEVAALVVGLPLAAALAWLLARSRFGAAVRVVGGSPEAARQAGRSVSLVRATALALAGVVGVLAALLAAPMTLLGIPQAAGLTLRAVAAAWLADDRPLVAVLVGLGFGLAEAVLGGVLPGSGADLAVAVVVVVALVARGADSGRAWGRAW